MTKLQSPLSTFLLPDPSAIDSGLYHSQFPSKASIWLSALAIKYATTMVFSQLL